MIRVQLNESLFSLGDSVTGSCQWLPSGDEDKKTAKLRVGWRTEGRGDVDREAIYEAELTPQNLTRFSCKIPPHAPPSYDGELLRIIWEVGVDFTAIGLKGRIGLGKSHEAQTFRVVTRPNP